MTKFLLKHFVKGTSKKNLRVQYGVLSGSVGIFCNVFLSALKFFIGTVIMSISVVADAANNLSDAISSVVTLVGFKMSSRPADDKHPFGHGRIEYVSGLAVSMCIVVMGVEFVKSSIEEIICPQSVEFKITSILLLAASALVKLWLYFFNKKLAKDIDSTAMKAAAIDSLNDVLVTFTVISGMVVTKFTGYDIDGWIGVLVALFIVYTGFSTAKETLSPLLGQQPDPEFVKKIKDLVISYDGILGVHDVMVHNYGPMCSTVSLHAEVPSETNLFEIHNVVDQVEFELKERFGCDAVIHLDPVVTDDELTNQMKNSTAELAKKIDEEIGIRDFRMFREHGHVVLAFDVVIPYEFRLSDKEVVNKLKNSLSEIYPNYVVRTRVNKNV